jgi:hypothetical protein
MTHVSREAKKFYLEKLWVSYSIIRYAINNGNFITEDKYGPLNTDGLKTILFFIKCDVKHVAKINVKILL